MRRLSLATTQVFPTRSLQFFLVVTLVAMSAASPGMRQRTALAHSANEHTRAATTQINQVPVVTISAASFELAALAPSAIASAFGTQLATRTEIANSLPLPTNLAGTTVRVKDSVGADRTAVLFFVSANQINFVVPDDTAAGTATLTVQSGDGTTSQGTLEIKTVAPAIFTANSTGTGAPAAVLLRVKANGTQIFEEVAEFDATLGIRKPKAIDLTPPGDQVFLVGFLTGIRRAPDPNNDGNKQESVHLLLGGTELTPLFVGAQGGFAGLDQLNVELPRTLIGRGRISLSITGPGVSSNLTELEFSAAAGNAPPAINGFSDTRALAGQQITINGNGFSSNLSDNLVRIGSTDALVTAASATQITVVVPFGAESGVVSVRTNQGEGHSNNSLLVRTSLSGQVETTSRQPLGSARVKFTSGGTTVMVQTGSNGSFVLPDLPGGLGILEVDATNLAVSPPFTVFRQLAAISANRDNPVSRPIALQQSSGAAPASGQVGGSGFTATALSGEANLLTLSAPTYNAPDDTNQTPGLQTGNVILQVPANAPALFPNGATSGVITLTQVENSRTPTALPTGVFSSTIVQITPFNVKLLQGAKFTFPNADNFPAGTQLRLYRLDQTEGSGTLGQFIEVGTATVSGDGQRIETAANAVMLTSYYFVANPRPTTTVTGRVLDSDRTPVRFATVRTRGQEGFTDGSGGFILRNVPVESSNTTLTVEAAFARPNGRVDRAQSANVRAVPGGITDVGEIILPAATSNQPPVVLISSELSVIAGETRDIPFLVNDPDSGLPVQVIVAGLSFVSVVQTPTPAIRLAPGPNDVGTYGLALTARDNQGGVTLINIRLTVLASNNRRPVLTVPGAQMVNAGQALSFAVSATDADAGQTLTYTATGLPSGASFNAATRQFSWTPTAAQAGTYTVTFNVTDNGTPLLSDSKQVVITVVAANTGIVRGTVRNAVTGQPLAGATVAIANTNLTTTSASDGTYTLSNVPPGNYNLNASASGFVSTQVQITIVAGQTLTQNLSLSTVLATGQLRITLNWTKDANGAPDDLDAHLYGPAGNNQCFHVYFNNTGSLTASPFAALEVDNIELSGSPPTETVRIAQQTPGTYRFFINNFSEEQADGLSRSRATVQIFGSNGLLRTYVVPSGAGAYWHVFELNGQTGAITDVNLLANAAPSFTCGSTNCSYSISPTNQSFAANGGTGSTNVTTQANCAWTATSNASWLTITSGASGNGSGTVGYSVAANTAATQRTGTLTVAGQTFTVTQAGSTAFILNDHRTFAGPFDNTCTAPTTKSIFLPTDQAVYQWTLVSGAKATDVVRWDWIQPDGSVYTSSAPLTLGIDGRACFSHSINIAGQRAASLPGVWLVRVYYNNTLLITDTFGIANSAGIVVGDHRTTLALVSEQTCDVPVAKTNFLTTDARAYAWFFTYNGSVGDQIRWDFINPRGAVFSSVSHTRAFAGDGCFWAFIPIAGQGGAAAVPGNWQVRTYYKSVLMFTDNFTITGPAGIAPPLVTTPATSGAGSSRGHN